MAEKPWAVHFERVKRLLKAKTLVITLAPTKRRDEYKFTVIAVGGKFPRSEDALERLVVELVLYLYERYNIDAAVLLNYEEVRGKRGKKRGVIIRGVAQKGLNDETSIFAL